jgi:hypothetical protein
MITQCLSAVCALGIAILGILVMVRAISLEEAAKTVGRIVLIIVLVLVGLCLLRQADLLTLMSSVKAFVLWLVVTVLVIAPLMLALGMLFARFQKRLSDHGTRDRGEP